MAAPKTSERFRIDTATRDKLVVLAAKDNRTLNNLVETLLMHAVRQPNILSLIKDARKPLTLGQLLGEVQDITNDFNTPRR